MNSYWPLYISAGITLLLAVAAFWAVWQNYRFRKEDRVLNTKAQALEDIHKWVDDIIRMMFLSYSPNEEEKREAKMHFQLLSSSGTSIIIAGGIFGRELIDKIQAALKSLDKFNAVLWREGAVNDQDLFQELWSSLFDVLKVVHLRKIELLPSTEYYKKE